jgi:hypothetical protein
MEGGGLGGGAEEALKDFTLTALLIKNYVISNWSLASLFIERGREVLKSSTVGRSPSFSFTYRLLEQKSLTQRGIYTYSCKLRSKEDYKTAHHISGRNLHKSFSFCIPLWSLWSFCPKQNNDFLKERLSLITRKTLYERLNSNKNIVRLNYRGKTNPSVLPRIHFC